MPRDPQQNDHESDGPGPTEKKVGVMAIRLPILIFLGIALMVGMYLLATYVR